MTKGLITPFIATLNSKPLYPYRIPIDPFQGALKGTLITTHEPPSKVSGVPLERRFPYPKSLDSIIHRDP